MSSASVGCGVIGAITLILIATGVGSYYRLADLDEDVDNAWSQIKDVYERRVGLVPNLVNTIEGAQELERKTLAELLDARAKVEPINFEAAPDAGQLARFETAQSQLSSALSQSLAAIERYPEINTTDAFRNVRAQLETIEIQITMERNRFNERTLAYNETRRRIPTILLANLAGFGDKPYFEATPAR